MPKLQVTKTIAAHLSEDPVLKLRIEHRGLLSISLKQDPLRAILGAIIGQQLSNKVSAVIWNRFETFLAGEITPVAILNASDDALRALGISYAKIKYLKNVSESILLGQLDFERMRTLSDEDAMHLLTQIKGIGPWTAEMFMIFTMGRENIFSLGDVSLQRAIEKLYKLDNLNKSKMKEISDYWSPYRTYGALYLWDFVDEGESMW